MIRLSRSFRGCVLPGLREILLAKGIKRRPDSFRGITNAATKPYQRSSSAKRASGQDILLPQRRIRPVLGFQDDGAGCEGADGVPLACGDVQGDGGAVGREFDRFNAGAEFVVKFFDQLAAENDHGFGGMPMPVNGQRSAGLNGVEHPLRLVLRGIAKVQIHPQPRRGLRLRGQIVQYSLCNLHIRSVMSNPADVRALSHLSVTKGMIYLSRSFRGTTYAAKPKAASTPPQRLRPYMAINSLLPDSI